MNGYDLHVHTEASPDCSTSLEELAEAVRRRDLTGIAVTDHDTIEAALRLQERRPPFEVVIGCEVTLTCGAHLIGLFLLEAVKGGTLAETAAAIRRQGGTTVLAHPFRPETGLLAAIGEEERLAEIVPHIDMVEVLNAKSSYAENCRAMALARTWGIPATAGSDAHRAAQVGFGLTRSTGTSRDLLRAETVIAGFDQTQQSFRRIHRRREEMRMLALRFKRAVPDVLWQWGKSHWEERLDRDDAVRADRLYDYGRFAPRWRRTDDQNDRRD